MAIDVAHDVSFQTSNNLGFFLLVTFLRFLHRLSKLVHDITHAHDSDAIDRGIGLSVAAID